MATVTYEWNAAGDLDFLAGLGVPPGSVFDPLSSTLRVGGGHAAQQFDVYQAGGAIALVLVRNPDGSPIAPGQGSYAYIPGMTQTQVGAFAGDTGRNVLFADGSVFIVGDGSAVGAGDDLGGSFDFSDGVAADFYLTLGGDDTVAAGGGGDRVLLNQGNDAGHGGPGDDSIYGGQGNDHVFGEEGNDLVFGDFGDDTVSGGPGNNVLFGGGGNDVFELGNGGDTAYGGGGDDDFLLSGIVGVKLLYGDKGNDRFEFDGTAGDWRVFGGAGSNDYDYRAHQGPIYTETGDGDSHLTVSDALAGLTIFGGPDRDIWTVEPGEGFRHTLDTGDGDDVLALFGPGNLQSFLMVDLGGGADVLDLGGYAGSDQTNWFLGGGADTIHGGSGGQFHVGGGANVLDVGVGRAAAILDDAYLGGGSLEFEGYRPGFDRVRISDAFGVDDVVGYRGNGLAGTMPTTNWLIANDQEYTIDTFDSFLSATQADTAKPGFFTFLDGHVQTWFTFDMTSTAGAIRIVDYTTLTTLPQLGAFSIGPGGDLDLLGGD